MLAPPLRRPRYPTSRRLPRACALLAALGLTMAAGPTAAAERVLISAPDSHRVRFAAELRSVGLEVVATGAIADLAGLRDAALKRRLRVGVRVAQAAATVEIWATLLPGRARAVRVVRAPGESAGGMALRVAELVYAWITAPEAPPLPPASRTTVVIKAPEATTPASKPPTTTATAPATKPKPATKPAAKPASKPKATTRPREPAPAPAAATPTGTPAAAPAAATPTSPSWWVLRAGSGVDASPGGLSLGAVAHLAVLHSWPGLPRLEVGAVGELPLLERTVSAPNGTAAVDIWSVGVELRWRLLSRDRGALHIQVGGGAVWTHAEGTGGSSFFSGREVSAWSGQGWAGFGGSLRLVGDLSLRVDGRAMLVEPRPVVVINGDTAATWGRPGIRATAALELRL